MDWHKRLQEFRRRLLLEKFKRKWHMECRSDEDVQEVAEILRQQLEAD